MATSLICAISRLLRGQNAHGLKLYGLAALLHLVYGSLCSPYLLYAGRYVLDAVMIFLADKLYTTMVSKL